MGTLVQKLAWGKYSMYVAYDGQLVIDLVTYSAPYV